MKGLEAKITSILINARKNASNAPSEKPSETILEYLEAEKQREREETQWANVLNSTGVQQTIEKIANLMKEKKIPHSPDDWDHEPASTFEWHRAEGGIALPKPVGLDSGLTRDDEIAFIQLAWSVHSDFSFFENYIFIATVKKTHDVIIIGEKLVTIHKAEWEGNPEVIEEAITSALQEPGSFRKDQDYKEKEHREFLKTVDNSWYYRDSG